MVGNAVSTLGNAVYLVAVLLLLKELTESAFVMGLFQFVAIAPGFFLSPVTGALVDRMSRRTVIIVADLFRGVVMIAASGLLLFPATRSAFVVLIAATCIGIGNAFFVPAVQALIPSLVPASKLRWANGVRAGGTQLFNLAGNAVGGLLYVVLGAPLLFLINGASFVLSALQESFIRPDASVGA
ncbi:MAG: MFS transporter, partial [Spirochaetaceae bacterium]